MIKSIAVFITLLVLYAQAQTITHYSLLPLQTTRNVTTDYSFLFGTDTHIPSYAKVAITFPFEYRPRDLNKATRVRYSIGSGQLTNATWSIALRTFTIAIDSGIPIGNLTVLIESIRNPEDHDTSSEFIVETLFKNVVITKDSQYGRVPFTKAPTVIPGGIVSNQANPFIEQGATWKFRFTPSQTYPADFSLRFIFP